jgi:peptidoglycan/LPS O-acetylase OafA/YrhL
MKEASKRGSVLKYRPDIDGLRSIAVLSVIGFHLSPSAVPGGFVGVDVFFVISGYLISAIVFSEISNGEFSVIAFYERRIRRIFPALFGMLIGVSAVISFFLLPREFIDYAKSVIAATASLSNFYFWRHSSYFDSPMSKPLLHTWSLAVEEQFYILFPIFLVTTRRFFPRRLKVGVVVLFFASLATSQLALFYNATTAFYMPYTRAWELLLGTIISLGPFPNLRMQLTRNIVSLLGIALIGYSIFGFSPQTPFPALGALGPCIGSALITGAGESGSSLVGKMLSCRPLVFVGLISYSLYLWHWPIIVLNGLGLPMNVTAVVPDRWTFLLLSQTTNKIIEVLVSFVLAVFSWRFIERPFRRHPRRIERRPLFAVSAAVMVVLLLSSAAVIYARGFQGRFPVRAMQIASFLVPPGASTLGQLGDCVITQGTRATVFENSHCLNTTGGKQTYVVLGDSHAGSLFAGLKALFPSTNFVLAGVWGCRPSIRSQESTLCEQMMHFMFQRYLPSHEIQGLLLEARWYPKSLNGVGEIVAWCKAHGLTVIVFGPVAEYDAPLPRLLAYSIAWKKPRLGHEHLLAYSPIMDVQMRNLAENSWHVPYISLYKAACGSDRCLEYANQRNTIPLLNDGDHLSEAGSRLLVRRLARRGELDWLREKLFPKTSYSSATENQGDDE